MNYDEQYCEKHNQPYGKHLDKCPICVGEKMKGKLIVKFNSKPEPVPVDDGGLVIEAHEAFF